ncbi:MAG: hypothetical protein Roseis2KO_18380 [Roseivirga sp.]
MKNIKNIFLILLALAMVACGDPELPFETFEDLEKGAYARRLSLSGAFTFGQAASSSYQGSVEFYSEDQGQNVASYDWTVEYTGVAGDRSAVNFLSIPASSFGTNSDTGLPMATFTLGMTDALNALGLSESDITGGDRFRFRATVVLVDGRTFSIDNTGTNIISSASFAALTLLDANVVCVSALGGTINYSNANMFRGGGSGAQGASCGAAITGTFDIIDDGDGTYTFESPNGNNDQSFGMFDSCWSDDPQTGDRGMTDVCGLVDNRGTDKYGDTYYWTALSGAGTPSITFDWINDWGDRGTVTLTRDDGNNWPAELKTPDQ